MHNAELVGRDLGQYRIVEQIGRGGMAVVYKAWQPSLSRYVALKVLPEYFRHDPQFLKRFRREAQAAAHLDHPNIVKIYDTASAEGLHFIVMEYLEGGSLADQLRAGPMDLDGIQGVIEQVGSALDYAHKQGLIHRDIKPANILFEVDGTAKVTDFGIVRAADSTRLTQTGAILGTPEYMSPEQAEGRAVDYRTDLYALGVVLYQALAGQVPFRGTTPYAVMHATIYQPPPLPRQINPLLSEPFEAVLLKALAKDPAQRFQRGAAMAQALHRARGGETLTVPKSARQGVRAAQPERIQIRPGVLAAAVGAVLALAVIGWLLFRSSGPAIDKATATALARPTAAQVTRQAGSGQPATPTAAAGHPDSGTATAAALNPEQLIATADEEGRWMAERRVAQTQTAAAVATEEAADASAARTREAESDDASATREAMEATRAAVEATQGAVAATETALAQPTKTFTPMPVPATATGPPPATNTPQPPSDRRLAFTTDRDGNREVYIMNGDGGGVERVTSHGAEDRFPALAPDGRRVAYMSRRDGNWEIYVQNLDGKGFMRLTNNGAIDRYPSWSPNGSRIAFVSDRDGNQEIYVMNPDGSGPVRLTNHGANDRAPAWSPDGSRITFASERSGNLDIWVMNSKGGDATQLTNTQVRIRSPSGRRMAAASPSCVTGKATTTFVS